MDPGTAVGIASLGFQVCQGLLSYYDGWKGYGPDITNAYNYITVLAETLVQLRDSLNNERFDRARTAQVESCLQSCEDGLTRLSKKLRKLQAYTEPEGLREKTWDKIQKAWYPCRASTLVKLRETADDVHHRLMLAIQALQLDISADCQEALAQVAADLKNTAERTVTIESSVVRISAQNERILGAQQADRFGKIIEWLSPPDSLMNHALARRRHEPGTGAWLLQSDQYQKWKAGEINHMWLHGKAGCGKTVLCSTVIEDIQAHCANATDSGYGMFYFSFSDNQKQSYDNLLLSLVAQFAWKEPVMSLLLREYEHPDRKLPGPQKLETILLSSTYNYKEIFILIDALDECPEDGSIRQSVLGCLERLSRQAPNLKIFASSRELRDVRETMEILVSEPLPVPTCSVDRDIQSWVSMELSRDRRLARLDVATKASIQQVIAQKANGMFRWAYCQLQELRKLKSIKPKYVKEILSSLPATLDKTYERILANIGGMYHAEALNLLKWLAFSQRPLSLRELAETTIIDPSEDGTVDSENRGDVQDVLDILSGLITTSDIERNNDPEKEIGIAHSTALFLPHGQATKMELAHFSVKEFLTSDRVSHSYFRLQQGREHQYIARSCLTYLRYYSSSNSRKLTNQDFSSFPLLEYASSLWFIHSRQQADADWQCEFQLLSSEDRKRDWLLAYNPDVELLGDFRSINNIGCGLYYAALLGLEDVVGVFLSTGTDVDSEGGRHGSALQAAAREGHERIVQMLIKRGSKVNAAVGDYGNALQAASRGGHKKIVEMLIANGADVNANGGIRGNALQAESYWGHGDVVELLIDKGANVNARGGKYGNALQAASYTGAETVVGMLIHGGADINARGGTHGYALHAASLQGHQNIVEMLVGQGVDINAQGGCSGNAVVAASSEGHAEIVQMLVDHGANVDAPVEEFGSALQAASFDGHENVARVLIDAGANVCAYS